MTTKITILIHDKRFTKHRALARKVVARGLRAEDAGDSVTVVLSNDREVRQLNHDFRGMDKPTNVLAFPNYPSFPRRRESMSGGLRKRRNLDSRLRGNDIKEDVSLGDIVLAYETLAREAKAQKKTFADHFAHLLLHGLLHLMGYDHASAKEAKLMESREIALLAAMGVANPYGAH